MTIREQLEEAKKEHGIKYKKLADMTDNHRSNISKILRSKIDCHTSTAEVIADKMGYHFKLVKKEGGDE